MNAAEIYSHIEADKQARQAEAHAAQLALPSLLSGEATWLALKQGVEDMTRLAPKDYDVLIRVDDVRVLEVKFVHPHSFLFEGLDQGGNHTRIIIHFSQLNARVVYLPKRGPERVISILSGAA